MSGGVVVVGQVGRDLVLRVRDTPPAGGTTSVTYRRETLGGKGANQAVALAQLGVPVAVIGTVGVDAAGDMVSAQAGRDGIDTTALTRRGRTALLIDLVDDTGRRLFEDVPVSSLVSVADIERSAAALQRADTVSVQLQQPPDTAVRAAFHGRRGGARVVADGGMPADVIDELLPLVDVLRADAKEADQLAGDLGGSTSDPLQLAQRLLAKGPSVVALPIAGQGDVLAWRGDHCVFPYPDGKVVDVTGAGDAFTAALIAALRRGASYRDAGAAASHAAARTVGHLGGRPDLSHG